ncbi:MgtC/SapB family protein [Paenibacillus sp.]|uniref:MgtC/SapB family protein n=1 Tax=Paenibacillus sp. TaxID=58172 RepID=UPI00281244A9|nr:MgtC/SapB family protein [Paenibacillus sp.]
MNIIETAGVWQISYLDLTLRVVVALLLGGLIGIEREWNHHAAGFRTHLLVCVGSAAIMLLSIYGFSDFADEYNVRMDPARLAAQVVSGIGFLGAGAIIRTGVNISGLTTAASIWVVAAIGLCAGAGFYYGATLITVLVLIILFLLNKVEKRMHRRRNHNEVKMKVARGSSAVGKITEVFDLYGLQIANVSFESEMEGKLDEAVCMIRVVLNKPNPKRLIEAIDALAKIEGILSFETPKIPRESQAYASTGSSASL